MNYERESVREREIEREKKINIREMERREKEREDTCTFRSLNALDLDLEKAVFERFFYKIFHFITFSFLFTRERERE